MWLREQSIDGVNTVFPPEPEYKDKLECSMCGGKVQFLHFTPAILSLLKPDEEVPSFCSASCIRQFVKILKKAL